VKEKERITKAASFTGMNFIIVKFRVRESSQIACYKKTKAAL
jgi:hypothetical protein